MAIVTKGSGGSIRFSGSGGRLHIPGSDGGGGGGGFSYRYYRMVIKETKFTQGLSAGYWWNMEMAEVELLLNSSRVDYTGATATGENEGMNYGAVASNVIDNNPATKWYTSTTPSPASPVILKIDFGTARSANAFRYMTTAFGGVGSEGRDPVQWTFEGSNDNSSWTTLHTQSTNATITSDRQAWTQEFPFTV